MAFSRSTWSSPFTIHLMLGLLLSVTFHTNALHLNLSNSSKNSSKGAQGVHFIRIQKTASTTFGEHILPRFCTPHENCWGFWHTNWTQNTADNFRGALVTIFRDPVERTLSEFFYLRTADGRRNSKHAQWDFRNRTWLRRVETLPVDEALLEYLLGYPKSPSRNRQTLYLLGFRDNPLPPGAVYDWDKKHKELLNKAKLHLERLHVYGFTDCYITSMRAIARPLGWPEDSVVALAREVHAREQNKVVAARLLNRYGSGRNRPRVPDGVQDEEDIAEPDDDISQEDIAEPDDDISQGEIAETEGEIAENEADISQGEIPETEDAGDVKDKNDEAPGNQSIWPGFPSGTGHEDLSSASIQKKLSRTAQPNDVVHGKTKRPLNKNAKRVNRNTEIKPIPRSPRSKVRHSVKQDMQISRGMTWHSILNPHITKKIRELNAVDVDLVDYARMRFADRFGLKCK